MLAITMLILNSTGSGIESLDLIGHAFLWIAAILTLVTGYSYLKTSSKYF